MSLYFTQQACEVDLSEGQWLTQWSFSELLGRIGISICIAMQNLTTCITLMLVLYGFHGSRKTKKGSERN